MPRNLVYDSINTLYIIDYIFSEALSARHLMSQMEKVAILATFGIFLS